MGPSCKLYAWAESARAYSRFIPLSSWKLSDDGLFVPHVTFEKGGPDHVNFAGQNHNM